MAKQGNDGGGDKLRPALSIAISLPVTMPGLSRQHDGGRGSATLMATLQFSLGGAAMERVAPSPAAICLALLPGLSLFTEPATLRGLQPAPAASMHIPVWPWERRRPMSLPSGRAVEAARSGRRQPLSRSAWLQARREARSRIPAQRFLQHSNEREYSRLGKLTTRGNTVLQAWLALHLPRLGVVQQSFR